MRNLLLALLVLTACSDKAPKRATITETIPDILVPPGGTPLGREGGEDAMKLRFKSTVAPAAVGEFYRTVLSKAPWHIVNYARMTDGSIALYAEHQGGKPLWVTIRQMPGEPGSLVDLLGAKTGP
jgi:hypothetical protein